MSEIENTISKLRHSPDELGGFLLKLSKTNPMQAIKLTEYYENLLFDKEDWYLKKVGLYALLFQLKIDKDNYKQRAVSLLMDNNEDEEVRRWAINGLVAISQVKEERDLSLIEYLYQIMNDNAENYSIRVTSFEGLMQLLGFKQAELIDKYIVQTYDNREDFLEKNLPLFKNEIDQIKNILRR